MVDVLSKKCCLIQGVGGSGKTTLIAEFIRHLKLNKDLAPVLTFTNAAA